MTQMVETRKCVTAMSCQMMTQSLLFDIEISMSPPFQRKDLQKKEKTPTTPLLSSILAIQKE